jgi:hypothetical protein
VTGLAYSTIFVEIRSRTSEDAPRAIAELKEQLPPGTQLVSLGPAHHLFLFLYQQPVRELKFDDPTALDRAGTDYFCVWRWKLGEDPDRLPFEWRPITVISCDRNRRAHPVDAMLIGKRVRTTGERLDSEIRPVSHSVIHRSGTSETLPE